DYSYQGRGFTANYTTTDAKCGGHYTAAKGTIFSPNFPKIHDKNDTCEWLIDIDENHVIELSFIDLDLYSTPNCSRSYVKVYDGPTMAYPVLQKLCGNIKPNNTVQSTYNQMYIEFRAHPFIPTKGFKAEYH
ncbi:hypothetical protein NQ317_013740, partial [Molorchus minor]